MDLLGQAEEAAGPTPAERARARLHGRLASVRAAAEEWNMRHDTPEGALLSALMGSITEMGQMSAEAIETLTTLIDGFRDDLDRQRAASQDSADQLAVAAGDAQGLVGQLKLTTDRAELVKENIPGRVAALIAPDLGQALRAPLEAKLRWQNRSSAVRQLMTGGALALTVFVAGVVAGQVEKAPSLTDMQVDWCEAHPVMAGNKGYCDLDRLRPLWRSGSG